MSGSTPLLEVKNLQKYFPVQGGFFGQTIGRVHAVDNISFTVRKGKTLGLVGESGCGKSTLGRAVLRLTEPSGGEVLYEGKDITKLSSEELRALRKDLQLSLIHI
jgi:ABC-type oligopeptide transport system ATPase subunit